MNYDKKFRLKISLLSLPSICGFAVFYIIPFFRSIGYSFLDNVTNKELVGLIKCKEVLANKHFRMALKNTVIFSVVGVAAIMILSLALSIALVRLSKRFSFIKSFVMPYVLPSESVVFFWQMFFDTQQYTALTELESFDGFFDVLPLYVIFI